MPVVVTPILPVVGQTPAVAFENGTLLSAAALATYAVTSPMMAGIEVTVCTTLGCSTHVWQTSLPSMPSTAGVETADFIIFIFSNGDTFTNGWKIQNLGESPIVSLAINGVPGRIMFDTNLGPKAPNSALGKLFITGTPGVLALYSHKANIGGTNNEDQYGCLGILFTDPIQQYYAVIFMADTDQLGVGVDFDEPAPPMNLVVTRGVGENSHVLTVKMVPADA